MNKKILLAVVIVGILTVIFGTIYVAVQQEYRQSANDPQIALAQDTEYFLSNGGNPQVLLTSYGQTNFAKSLTPFVIVFDDKVMSDKQGKVLVSTGSMDGVVPIPPSGVFSSGRNPNMVTWQPRSDARIASVIVPYATKSGSGYVLAGRNLREVEARESSLGYMVLFGWVVSVAGVILFVVIRSMAK